MRHCERQPQSNTDPRTSSPAGEAPIQNRPTAPSSQSALLKDSDSKKAKKKKKVARSPALNMKLGFTDHQSPRMAQPPGAAERGFLLLAMRFRWPCKTCCNNPINTSGVRTGLLSGRQQEARRQGDGRGCTTTASCYLHVSASSP